MPWTSEHLRWLFDTGEQLTSNDGMTVDIWELKVKKDDAVFSAWARHFRNHYCLDCEIDELRDGTGFCRSDYLCE